MSTLWPTSLLLLLIIPTLIGLYIWVLRRRRRYAVRFSSLALVRQALPRYSRLRRHLPFALFLAAIASLVVAMSRPVAIVTVPSGQVTILLSIDVSRSMCSTDIKPSRLLAAEQAALDFIRRQNAYTQIGIVAFGGFAEVIQAPTNDQELLQSAIESLLTGRRTAIGSGILKALDAIAEVDPNVAPSTGHASEAQPTPVPKGAYAPDIIVLLTDGVSNSGPTPLEAAQQAADRGVRVYTIGYGTDHNDSIPFCNSQFLGQEPFDFGGSFGGGGGGGTFGGGGGFGGGGFGGGFRRGIDEETLKQIADMTGGKYYAATSASELNDVFKNLPTYLITKHATMEISVVFAALGAIIASLAIGLSLLWRPLI